MAARLPLSTNKDQGREEPHLQQILDTVPEAFFERLVTIAQGVFNVSSAFISLISEERHEFKMRRGPSVTELSFSFCTHTVEQDEMLVVLDTLEDERFATLPDVVSAPFVRFYAGAPLVTPQGHKIGTLCVFDGSPRQNFSAKDRALLVDLANLIVDALGMRIASQEAFSGRVHSIFESITEAFYTLDASWRFTYVTAHAERLLGRSRNRLLGRTLWEEFPEARDSQLYKDFHQAAATQRSTVLQYLSASRSSWSEIHAYPSPEGMSVYFQNIDERKANERRIQAQTEFRRDLLAFTQTSLQHGLNENFYQHLLDIAVRTIPGAQAGSLVVREDDEFHFVAALGFELEPLRACTFTMADLQFDAMTPAPKLVSEWRDEELGEERQELLETYGLTGAMKVSLCMPIIVDGQPLVVLYLDNFDDAEAFDEDAIEMANVLAQQAASLVKRLELESALRTERKAFEYAANHDTLTGLPNRSFFEQSLDHALNEARMTSRQLAVMFIDLDNFKDVNDTFGHGFGDALIRSAASRCAYALRQEDVLARWGGDEFVVLLPEVRSISVVRKIAERILASVMKRFTISGQEVRTSVSIGIAMYEGNPCLAEDLVRDADIALYRAKIERGSYRFFTRDLQESVNKRVLLSEDLRNALDIGALTLHYQPRVRLSDSRVTSVEALARWCHPTKGMISPGVFIPLAEELGLIQQLGNQILHAACVQAREWRDQGRACRVAVNVSVHQLKHPAFVEEVRRVLHESGLEPDLLELEVTESSAMDEVGENIKRLSELRGMGVRLAIDDFGTAYSSLAQLKRLPLDSLKIDQSFVHDLTNNADDRGLAIVRAIIMLGQSLGLKVIAEGVETDAQRIALMQLGCEEAQGYLFAKPAPASVLEISKPVKLDA